MTTEAVVSSFARAIEHHHVLEDSSERIADHVVASSDLSAVNEHRELVQQMILNLDNEIEKVSVRHPVSRKFVDCIERAAGDCEERVSRRI
jgi:hypothetical protein